MLDRHHFLEAILLFSSSGDCIIAEVGFAQFGTLEIDLPQDASFFTQLYYSCIGFTVGVLVALVARRRLQKSGRVLIFVGSGNLHERFR